MAWNDRLKEAAYTSPSGTRQTFIYEDVAYSIEKKTSEFNFPDADGALIQDLGHAGRKFPLRLIFSGEDCDLEADAFAELLLERGAGILEHPRYGVRDVVPFGDFRVRDDLKTAANQVVIETTFYETIGLVYPTAQADPETAVETAVEEYNETAAEEFEEVTFLEDVPEQETLKPGYQLLLDRTKAGLQNVADYQADVRRRFNNINDSINNAIDILIGTPLTLAFQTMQLIQAPARALENIGARLDAYRNLAAQIIGDEIAPATPLPNEQQRLNQFHSNNLFVATCVTGAVTSVVNNQFETKVAALTAAEEVISQFEAAIAWRDAQYQIFLAANDPAQGGLGIEAYQSVVDSGESYQKLQEAVALCAGFLVEISFTLKQERSITLDRARTVIDLCAELYGDVSNENVDFLINTNNLTGSEILELPRGRQIVYYV